MIEDPLDGDARLRADIRELGEVLGTALKRLWGHELVELEESIRVHFDEAVLEYTNLPETNRQAALDEVLRGFSCVSIA